MSITVNRIRRDIIDEKYFLIVLNAEGINRIGLSHTILTMIYTMVYTVYNNDSIFL